MKKSKLEWSIRDALRYDALMRRARKKMRLVRRKTAERLDNERRVILEGAPLGENAQRTQPRKKSAA